MYAAEQKGSALDANAELSSLQFGRASQNKKEIRYGRLSVEAPEESMSLIVLTHRTEGDTRPSQYSVAH